MYANLCNEKFETQYAFINYGKPEQNYIQIDISFSLKNTSEETEQFLRVNLERTR